MSFFRVNVPQWQNIVFVGHTRFYRLFMPGLTILQRKCLCGEQSPKYFHTKATMPVLPLVQSVLNRGIPISKAYD